MSVQAWDGFFRLSFSFDQMTGPFLFDFFHGVCITAETHCTASVLVQDNVPPEDQKLSLEVPDKTDVFL
jgi:hypothetical protein